MANSQWRIQSQWDGEAFKPVSPFWQGVADRNLVVGQVYTICEIEDEQSDRSRRHYHACIRKAWQNLPEDLALTYPRPEHLRKKALIRMGWYDEKFWLFSTEADRNLAIRLIRSVDEFSVVSVADGAVVQRIAQSQAARAMKKEAFQASKDDVLGFCAALIGVTLEKLTAEGDLSDGVSD